MRSDTLNERVVICRECDSTHTIARLPFGDEEEPRKCVVCGATLVISGPGGFYGLPKLVSRGKGPKRGRRRR
jgi:ribosomal protein S27E